MKRLLTISLLATMPIAMFAYYGDYDSIEPSGTLKSLMVILFVWGILEVVLFFKVWGMTNDVKNIKNNMLLANTPELLRKYRLLGDNDKAAEVLVQNFLNELSEIIRFNNFSPKQNIEDKVKELEFQLALLGAVVPEGIKKLKTLEDYYNLGYMKTIHSAQFEEKQKDGEENSSEK